MMYSKTEKYEICRLFLRFGCFTEFVFLRFTEKEKDEEKEAVFIIRRLFHFLDLGRSRRDGDPHPLRLIPLIEPIVWE